MAIFAISQESLSENEVKAESCQKREENESLENPGDSAWIWLWPFLG